MRKAVLFGIVFALCILIAPSQIYVTRGNLWKTYLSGNAESLLLLFKDGELLVITENEENRVTIPWDYVFKNHEPSELLVVIHNHLRLDGWSESDKRLYHLLKNRGFSGRFLCRLGSGKIIEMEN